MIRINVPITVTGPGSQPVEADVAELDILQMPSGMDTYVPPPLPEPEDIKGLTAAKDMLDKLHSQLMAHRVGMPAGQLDLGSLDAANRELVDQVLGEGEVSVIFTGAVKARVQESVLAGVWRVKYLDADDRSVRDTIEVAAIPRVVTEATFASAADAVTAQAGIVPEGVLNAPPLLAEINDKVAAYRIGDDAHVINLTLLPQTEQDLAFLADRLGQGVATILSRGYGNCRVSSTATRYVWWVQYFNSQDRNILNSLEIAQVPKVACAAPEDIDDSAERLQEIMGIYQ